MRCTNIGAGNFKCEACPKGYRGDGESCTDIDEVRISPCQISLQWIQNSRIAWKIWNIVKIIANNTSRSDNHPSNISERELKYWSNSERFFSAETISDDIVVN